MEKSELQKGVVYEAKVVGGTDWEKVKIVTILEKTCTVELEESGAIALAKICDITDCRQSA